MKRLLNLGRMDEPLRKNDPCLIKAGSEGNAKSHHKQPQQDFVTYSAIQLLSLDECLE
jgi:hypothetical protein